MNWEEHKKAKGIPDVLYGPDGRTTYDPAAIFRAGSFFGTDLAQQRVYVAEYARGVAQEELAAWKSMIETMDIPAEEMPLWKRIAYQRRELAALHRIYGGMNRGFWRNQMKLNRIRTWMNKHAEHAGNAPLAELRAIIEE